MDTALATTFLQVIFGRVLPDQWISIFAIDRTANQSARAAQKVLWSPVDEIPALVERLAPLSPDHCIWYGVSSRRAKLDSGRGGTNDCALVPCLWADLDVTGPGHKSENLPPTEEAALGLLEAFPPPSFTVRTGGGLQPYWMLDEPMPVEEALPVLDRWYYTWKKLCDEHGWHIDNVFDPARILRLPSTINNKDLSAPLPVTMFESESFLSENDLSVFQSFYVYSKDDILACTTERPKVPVVAVQPWTGPMRAGDEFNRVHSIGDVLGLLGFTEAHTDGQGAHWTRPGKDVSQGTSATVYHDAPDRVTVFSSTCTDMWPALEVNHPYDAFGLLTVANYGGDFNAAAESLREIGFGTDIEPGPSLIDELGDYLADIAGTMDVLEKFESSINESTNGWDVVDLSDSRYAKPPPPPDLFERSDGVNLLYRGRIHYFYGKSESGKSWAAQVATVWTLQKGRPVVYIDFENDAWSVRERFEALGLDLEKTKHLLSYCSPNGPYTPIQWETFKKNLQGAELVIIDGVSDGMSMFGQDPLLNSDAVKFDRGFLRPLTSFGAAVVAIDHTPKSTEGPAAVFGAQHKKAAVTGAMFECRTKSPFGRGMVGTLTMRLEKDKPGYMRQHTENGIIAELTLTSHTDGSVDAELNPPGSGLWRPTIIMENFSFYLERHAGITAQELNTQGTHIQDPNGRKRAIEVLLKEGYITKDLNSRFFSRKPYRKGDEGRSQTQWAPIGPPPALQADFTQTTFMEMGLEGAGVSEHPNVVVPDTVSLSLTPVEVDREQELQDYLADPDLAFSDMDDMDLT